MESWINKHLSGLSLDTRLVAAHWEIEKLRIVESKSRQRNFFFMCWVAIVLISVSTLAFRRENVSIAKQREKQRKLLKYLALKVARVVCSCGGISSHNNKISSTKKKLAKVTKNRADFSLAKLNCSWKAIRTFRCHRRIVHRPETVLHHRVDWLDVSAHSHRHCRLHFQSNNSERSRALIFSLFQKTFPSLSPYYIVVFGFVILCPVNFWVLTCQTSLRLFFFPYNF